MQAKGDESLGRGSLAKTRSTMDQHDKLIVPALVSVDLVAELAEGVAHCQAQGDYLVVIPDEGCIKCAHNTNQGFAPRSPE